MPAAANTITIHERLYLLAGVGVAAHLVAEAGPAEPGRAIAVHEDDARLNPAYDEADLVDVRWRVSTLCGRPDWFMAPREVGSAYELPWLGDGEPVYAPTCRRCLRILDRQFAPPDADDRLTWNVIRCVEELGRWGCFMIDGVPAEQMELLRDQVRTECRRRGWRFQSSAVDRRLYATSENSLSAERRALVDRDAWERIRMVDSEVRPPRPSWQFGW